MIILRLIFLFSFFVTRYDKSALYFAMTERSFEEVALKFIEAQQTTALRMFLSKKLSALKHEVSWSVCLSVCLLVLEICLILS